MQAKLLTRTSAVIALGKSAWKNIAIAFQEQGNG